MAAAEKEEEAQLFLLLDAKQMLSFLSYIGRPSSDHFFYTTNKMNDSSLFFVEINGFAF